jgi:acyl carrier protein
MWDASFETIIRQHLPFLPASEPLRADMILREFGLDSMGIVEVLAKLERGYGIKFLDDALNMENFATPGSLWSVIAECR